MTVSADDRRILPGLATAAAGHELRVLVDCDTGLGRTGVATPAAAAQLARCVSDTANLSFGGFVTYPAPPGAASFLAEAVSLAAADGLDSAVVSVGGTPGMWQSASTAPPVTEYRAGTYAFHDRATVAAGAAVIDDVALTVLATVISRPSSDRAILDAGSKALTSDPGPSPSFGAILEVPGAEVTRVNEEHGYVTLVDSAGAGLDLEDVVHIVPNHACVVSNLFERFVVVSNGVVIDEWAVIRGR